MDIIQCFIVRSNRLPLNTHFPELDQVFELIKSHGGIIEHRYANLTDYGRKDNIEHNYVELPEGWGLFVDYDNSNTKISYFFDSDRKLIFWIIEKLSYKLSIEIQFYLSHPNESFIFSYPLPGFYLLTHDNYIIIDKDHPVSLLLNRLNELDRAYGNYVKNYTMLEKEPKQRLIDKIIGSRKGIFSKHDLSDYSELVEFVQYELIIKTKCPVTEREIYEYCVNEYAKLKQSIKSNINRVWGFYYNIIAYKFIIDIYMDKHMVESIIETKKLDSDYNVYFDMKNKQKSIFHIFTKI